MYSVYNELTRMVSSRMATKLILTQVDSLVYDIKFTFYILNYNLCISIVIYRFRIVFNISQQYMSMYFYISKFDACYSPHVPNYDLYHKFITKYRMCTALTMSTSCKTMTCCQQCFIYRRIFQLVNYFYSLGNRHIPN